jgi:hypothetical protein
MPLDGGVSADGFFQHVGWLPFLLARKFPDLVSHIVGKDLFDFGNRVFFAKTTYVRALRP